MSDRSGRAGGDVLCGRRPVLELLRAGRAAESILIAAETTRSNTLAEIRRRASDLGVPVKQVPRAEVDRIAEGLNHQGVVALTARFRYTPLEELLAVDAPTLLFLDRLTDPQNVGSLLRSADGAGFTGVVLPAHKSAAVTPVVRRVSAGAAEIVPIARVGNLGRALDEARGAGVWLVGLDAGADQDLWSSDLLEPPVGLVLGSEGTGLAPTIRSRCDGLVAIPAYGSLDSLNVAVAGAIAMFEIARRRGRSDTL